MIGTNLAFDSNYKMGSMEAFVLDFQKTYAQDRRFFWPAEPQRSIIDTSVYSKRRVMRTPLSFKLNDKTKTPLKLLQPWDSSKGIEEAFITNLGICASDLLTLSMEDISCVIPVEPDRSLHPIAGGRKVHGASARYGGGGSSNAVQAAALALPADVIQQLQGLLDAGGSKGCTVLDKPPVPGKNDGTPNFQCENVEKRRECLVCVGEVHKDNNAFLNIRSDGRVHYWCHAPSCNREGPKYIGDLKPNMKDTASTASASGGATDDMELDVEVEPLPLSVIDDELSDAASQSQSSSCGSSTDPAFCSLHGAVVRELAWMGPAENEAEVREILACAAEAAGGGHSEECVLALQAAASEWICRSSNFLLQATDEEIRAFREEAAALFVQDTSVSASCDALALLRSARYGKKDWINLCATTSHVSNGYATAVTSEQFIKSVDPQSTDALSMVLAARLLWPEDEDKFYDCVRFKFERSKVQGLAEKATFDGVWSLEADEAADVFGDFIMTKLCIMQHTFLRDILPNKMQSVAVAHYELSQELLSFWLDTADYPDSKVEYRFEFDSGNITSARGEGVIHCLYTMKPFFQKDCDVAILADLLVENGIKDRLRYDTDFKEWRIFNAKSGVWTCPPTGQSYLPEMTASAFVREHLEPAREVEIFFGRRLEWEKRIVPETLFEGSTPTKSRKTDQAVGPGLKDKEEQGNTGDPNLCETSNEVAAGNKRPISMLSTASSAFEGTRSRISEFFAKYTAHSFKHQTETIKALKDKVPFSFSKEQQPHLLCCPNGLVDLKTGKLLGKPTPDHFITQVCSTVYDPDADIMPAVKFFERYFPLGAYPDQQKIVAFMQTFIGYCLTRETDQQFCLILYGVGSNGKSLIILILHHVIGVEICKTLPFECLEKARGQNNDSLHEARHARVVTMEESNGRGKVNPATFKNLVCGETITNKTMYQTETNFKPVMKLIFVLNELPEFFNNKEFAMQRRTAIINMQTIFVDETKELEKQLADELRSKGAPECLIQVKDESYYSNHVAAHAQAFLRFFVLGAMAYYDKNKHIIIPDSMQRTAMQETCDPKEELHAFVRQRLLPSPGSKAVVDEIELAFREYARGTINLASYTRPMFGKHLTQIIDEFNKSMAGPSGWRDVYKRQEQQNNRKRTVWFNLWLSPTDLQGAQTFAPPQQPV